MSRARHLGEAEVANYLRRRGYTLLAHGFHCRFGEIDLIARKDGVLCFVEVKTRTNLSCGLPREYVTPKKQERLRKTAAWYLMVRTWTARPLRRGRGVRRRTAPPEGRPHRVH